MGILIQHNLWLKSIVWSTSWRARQMALPRAFSCLITHPVTSSVLQMPSLPPRWSRVHSYIIIFWLFCFIDSSQDLKHFWTHFSKGEHMCDGINSLIGERQSFYFPNDHLNYLGWFKGMEQIIHKCGLWPKCGLPVECTGSKHPEGPASCCCHHILYTQPDFILQKPRIQEYIKSHGHLCDFYPKYHCKLNFIEQYWGAAKFQFHVAGHARTLEEMEWKMLGCLDDIPLDQIWRCAAFPFLFED